MRKILLGFVLVLLGVASNSNALEKGPLNISGVGLEVVSSYSIYQMLFPNEEWKFDVILVPAETKQGSLIKISKELYKKYPKTRVRFFSDRKYIDQYIKRDIYINDTSGKVKSVDFPPDEWLQNHMLGNINNRSERYQRKWMLEDRYGNMIKLLDE